MRRSPKNKRCTQITHNLESSVYFFALLQNSFHRHHCVNKQNIFAKNAYIKYITNKNSAREEKGICCKINKTFLLRCQGQNVNFSLHTNISSTFWEQSSTWVEFLNREIQMVFFLQWKWWQIGKNKLIITLLSNDSWLWHPKTGQETSARLNRLE